METESTNKVHHCVRVIIFVFSDFGSFGSMNRIHLLLQWSQSTDGMYVIVQLICVKKSTDSMIYLEILVMKLGV
jgi:hypothetical protein